jgi:hypothetical protein
MPFTFALRSLKYRILAVAFSGILVFGALWLGVILYFKAEQTTASQVRSIAKSIRIANLQVGIEASEFIAWDESDREPGSA